MNFLEVIGTINRVVEAVKLPAGMKVSVKLKGGWDDQAFKTENFPTIEITTAAFSEARDSVVISAVKKAVKGVAVVRLGWTMSKNSFKTKGTDTTGWWVLPMDYKKRV